MSKTVNLKVTLEQAEAISAALDLYTRVCMGQFEIVAELVQREVVRPVVAKEPVYVEEVAYCDADSEGTRYRATCTRFSGLVGSWENSREEAIRSHALARGLRVSSLVREALLDAKKALGHPANGSHGIGNDRVHKSAHRAYEVKKVLDKAVAEDRNPNPAFWTFHYDGLSLRYTDDPAPTAVVA